MFSGKYAPESKFITVHHHPAKRRANVQNHLHLVPRGLVAHDIHELVHHLVKREVLQHKGLVRFAAAFQFREIENLTCECGGFIQSCMGKQGGGIW